jgi:hypothetical protein
MKRLLVIACILTACHRRVYSPIHVKPPTGAISFAYTDEDSSCTFLGWYVKGHLVAARELQARVPDAYSQVVSTILDSFPMRRPLGGLTGNGKPARVVISRINPYPDFGDFSVGVTVLDDVTSRDGVIFSAASLPFRILTAEPATLDGRAEAQLQERALELWDRAVQERKVNERPARFTLGHPRVRRVAEMPEFLTVLYPVEMDGDHRGSMFFIYSTRDHRLVRAEFGHPDWLPGSSVLSIRPEFFFSLPASSEVYFVANRVDPWYEWGHAIFNLRSGREVLMCY